MNNAICVLPSFSCVLCGGVLFEFIEKMGGSEDDVGCVERYAMLRKREGGGQRRGVGWISEQAVMAMGGAYVCALLLLYSTCACACVRVCGGRGGEGEVYDEQRNTGG